MVSDNSQVFFVLNSPLSEGVLWPCSSTALEHDPSKIGVESWSLSRVTTNKMVVELINY